MKDRIAAEDADKLRAIGLDPALCGIRSESELRELRASEARTLADDEDGVESAPPELFDLYPDLGKRVREAATVDELVSIVVDIFGVDVSREEMFVPLMRVSPLEAEDIERAMSRAEAIFVDVLKRSLPGSAEDEADKVELKAQGIDTKYRGIRSENDLRRHRALGRFRN